MDMGPLLEKLFKENPKSLVSEIVTFLIECCNDLLKSQTNSKFVTLPLEDVKRLFFHSNGGLECFLYFGYQKGTNTFNLPQPVDLKHIREIKGQLEKLVDRTNLNSLAYLQQLAISPKINFRPLTHKELQQYFQTNHVSEIELMEEVISCMNKVLKYEDESLQKAALSCIPLVNLRDRARNQCASRPNGDKMYKDLLLIELLSWFKTHFFRWFSKPVCSVCNKEMKNIGYGNPTEEDLMWEASRVELYHCSYCVDSKFRFPRYNHPGKLLTTRVGRCGEWTNCFGLLCRALSYETRFVNDFKDHVWNEVFSEQQNCWLHCDPCENICQKPLVYETGWGKKPSYILAFSKDGMQDVTWRYTKNFKETLSRRKSYREDYLLNLITGVTSALESRLGSNQSRLETLTNRKLSELVEFLGPQRREATEDETMGRSSGSSAWKQARGEAGSCRPKFSGFVFSPTANEIQSKEIHVAYSPVSDKYMRFSDKTELVGNWEKYTFEAQNIGIKVETDWKMAYLSRQEGVDGSNKGTISWKFDLRSTKLLVDRISLMCQSAIFENGTVVWKLANDDRTVSFSSGANMLNITDFVGSSTLILTAELSGGKGLQAWQHAQLFRVSLDSHMHPFVIRIILKEIN